MGPEQAPPETAPPASDSSEQTPHYLIAFKDHTIYSAIAYWVDGDTLHYFTSGNTHNQASLSLIDRDLTERLNRESGVAMRLPAPR
jgi:endonuclease YncB( thermonuclease family)